MRRDNSHRLKENIMNEEALLQELQKDPFIPLRLHLVSGKTVDILVPHGAWTLSYAILVFRNPTVGSPKAEGYDVVAYANIERVEQLSMGNRTKQKRKPA